INVKELAEGVIAGNRVALAKAITLVESTKEEHFELASELIEVCLPHCVESKRIGITGVPGVGKSTFIEALGTSLTSSGHKVAVLAVDPSSDLSKGSILGDKTRMEKLASDSNAFIRPTPSSGTLGGVARKTRETISLCEAAGFDVVLVETVGVGQSEVAVHSMVDMFLVMVLATAGDELQGIKRGIMELADMVVINKDDGDNANYTKVAKASYAQALHLFPEKDSGWTVPVQTCSSLENRGISNIWSTVESYFFQIVLNGFRDEMRAQQNKYWLRQAIEEELHHKFFHDPLMEENIKTYEMAVENGEMSPFKAAKNLLKQWRYNS
ncbi:methylmalonyl Co-A mutase-associated GTPase MeaB, partial [Bacteroidota bacterium]